MLYVRNVFIYLTWLGDLETLFRGMRGFLEICNLFVIRVVYGIIFGKFFNSFRRWIDLRLYRSYIIVLLKNEKGDGRMRNFRKS